MTTYDDAEVNGLVARIDLVSDDSVPRLCCSIEAHFADTETMVVAKMMTTEDFNFDRATVSTMVRRIGAEQGVPAEAYDRVERFVAELPDVDIDLVIGAFALSPTVTNADIMVPPRRKTGTG